jgi:hypothetical protein
MKALVVIYLKTTVFLIRKIIIINFFGADLSTKNKMAVVLSFWDWKLNSEMLKMKRCKDATAEGLFTALIAELAKSIPESQMVGFSADTCNAMFGEHNSVSQKLRVLAYHIPLSLFITCM